ncbi:MAG: hemerythrin domain-containing protein [Magnetococcus sp. WYHC-3]
MQPLVIRCRDEELEFRRDLYLDVAEIDAQHERLFRLAAGLEEYLLQSCGGGDDPHAPEMSETCPELDAALLELDAYVVEHLDFEESLLRLNKAPELSRHQLLHEEFRHYFEDLNLGRSQGRALTRQMLLDVTRFLVQWLADHVRQEDRRNRSWMVVTGGEIRLREPRIRVSGRMLLELSGCGGIVGQARNVSASGLLVHLTPPIPEWIQPGSMGLLHPLHDRQEGPLPIVVIRVVPDEGVAVRFQTVHSLPFLSTFAKIE